MKYQNNNYLSIHLAGSSLQIDIKKSADKVYQGERIIDIRNVHAEICKHYTRNMTESFKESVTAGDLEKAAYYGLHPLAVECELLKGIYNRISLESLMTIKLANLINEYDLNYDTVRFSKNKYSHGLSLSNLKQLLIENKKINFWEKLISTSKLLLRYIISYSSLLTGVIFSIYIVMLSKMRGESVKFSDKEACDNLFLLHYPFDNRSKHLFSIVTASKSKPFILLLGSGVQKYDQIRSTIPKSSIIRPWSRKSLPIAIGKVFFAWFYFTKTMNKSTRLCVNNSHLYYLLVNSANCLIRGLMHKAWVEENIQLPLSVPIKIGWSGWSDVTMFDLALQSVGCITEHYLHGLVGDPLGYWGVSNKCICKTKIDCKVMITNKVGYYDSISSLACGQKAIELEYKKENGIMLILTNIINLSNYRYKDLAEQYAIRLLKSIAIANNHDRKIVWKPHPCEPLNSAVFKRLSYISDKLGIEINTTDALSIQIVNAEYIISTFSSVLSDVIRSGRVPYVYANIPYEETPAWEGIHDELKFKDADQLRYLLKNDIYSELFHKHYSKLYEMYCYDNSLYK